MPSNRGLCLGARFLCMHKILVHAHSFCLGPLVPGPSSACTRVLCMHKSVVHAKEFCACTRILCMHPTIAQMHPTTAYFAPNRFHRLAPTVRQSYLLSGKATGPTVRQAKDSSQPKLPTVRQAKTVRQAPNRSIDFHPTSAYFAPNRFRIHAPKCFIDMHPQIRIHAPKSFRIHAFNSAYILNSLLFN